MEEEVPDFSVILEILVKHEVDFVVVGGVCAVLLGAPVTTFDLDIVHSRTKENVQRLKSALNELGAHYREHLPKILEPNIENLESSGHHLLSTKFGPLDILGSIGVDEDFHKLDQHIELVQLDQGMSIRILDLETLIRVKAQTARDKDAFMLEILKALRKCKLNGNRHQRPLKFRYILKTVPHFSVRC